jgi:hypothetical protein
MSPATPHQEVLFWTRTGNEEPRQPLARPARPCATRDSSVDSVVYWECPESGPWRRLSPGRRLCFVWERRTGRALVAMASEEPVRSSMPNAKSIGWAIYGAGFAIWLFGYLSAGHAPLFDWKVTTPWWISSFVPNLEAELGLALMFASMIPTLPWDRLFTFSALVVLGAVAIAWWWFLAWLIWRVI